MIHAEFGLAGFYKGLAPCALRSMPVNAFIFLGYELTMSLIQDL